MITIINIINFSYHQNIMRIVKQRKLQSYLMYRIMKKIIHVLLQGCFLISNWSKYLDDTIHNALYVVDRPVFILYSKL